MLKLGSPCGSPATEFFLEAGEVVARCAEHAQFFILMGDPRLTEEEALVAEVHGERAPR